MYVETLNDIAGLAAQKISAQRRSLRSHLIRAMLAGMYLGVMMALIYVVGAGVSEGSPGLAKLLMGVCFGGTLNIVLFAGSELFTGSNLVFAVGLLSRRTTWSDLLSNWFWTWIGNWLGAALMAILVVFAGIFDKEPAMGFVLKTVEIKMTLPPLQLFLRAVLANWMVCLGVWMYWRVKTETAKILLIWWCMFIFITSGYEHSVANMSALLFGLLLPHSEVEGISWTNYVYNLALATAGNIVGGALFVGAFYWWGTPARVPEGGADAAPPS